jgi:allantoin racemase
MERKRRWGAQGVVIETVSLSEGLLVLENEYQAAEAAWPLVQEVIKPEADGVDAVIIDCFADPAIDACREASSLPMIGPAQAGLMASLCLGDKVGIISPNESGLTAGRRRMMGYGVEKRISYWGSALEGTENMHKHPSKTRDALTLPCEKALASGECDVLLLGCTGFEPYWEGVKDKARIPIPVINPFPCAVKLAELFVSLGVSQSTPCYPRQQVTLDALQSRGIAK